MFNFKVSINNDSLIRETKSTLYKDKGVQQTVHNAAYKMYWGAKNRMFTRFDNHAITAELQAGKRNPYGTANISQTTDGYGNLYSFLGFDKGFDPTIELREYLNSAITFRRTTFRDGMWYFRIEIPSDDEVYNHTNTEHLGMSWVEGIEHGMTNLANYINTRGRGRSGGGVQAPHEVNDDLTFKRKRYTSELLEQFKNSILQQ